MIQVSLCRHCDCRIRATIAEISMIAGFFSFYLLPYVRARKTNRVLSIVHILFGRQQIYSSKDHDCKVISLAQCHDVSVRFTNSSIHCPMQRKVWFLFYRFLLNRFSGKHIGIILNFLCSAKLAIQSRKWKSTQGNTFQYMGKEERNLKIDRK